MLAGSAINVVVVVGDSTMELVGVGSVVVSVEC